MMDEIIKTKTCTKCKQEKSLEEFNKDKNKKCGRANICKKCRSIYRKKTNPKKKRYTLEYVRSKVQELGFEPLFDEYKNVSTFFLCKCPKHGEFKTSFKTILVGGGCSECAYDKKRNSFESIVNKFKSLDLILLIEEKDYLNQYQKLPFICNKHPQLGIQYIAMEHLNRSRSKHIGCKECRKKHYQKLYSATEETIYKQRQKIRTYKRYKSFKSEVMKKYNFTCQCCGKKVGAKNIPNIHHILNFSQNIDLAMDVDNAILFDECCHKKFHKIYGNQNNNQKQIDEFINNYKLEE